MERQPLIGLTERELQDLAVSLGMPKFVGRQIAQWIYQKGVKSFSEMANISKRNQTLLDENYCVGRTDPAASQKSVDGTVKYLFPVEGGRYVESVYIPDHDRATLCVSSQSGCKMNCYFCATGRWVSRSTISAP